MEAIKNLPTSPIEEKKPLKLAFIQCGDVAAKAFAEHDCQLH